MDKLPYEDAAMRGAPLPEGLDLTDAAVYVALRGLYAFHQLGMMDRKEAAAESSALKSCATIPAGSNSLNATLRKNGGRLSKQPRPPAPGSGLIPQSNMDSTFVQQ